MSSQSHGSMQERSARLLAYVEPLSVSKRLGENLQKAVEQAVQHHGQLWPAADANDAAMAEQLRRCEGLLELLADLHEAVRAAEQLYRLFLPSKISLFREDGLKESFDLSGLDDEGRPVYRCLRGAAHTAFLRWHRRKKGGGVWAAHTDSEGLSPGDLQLQSALPTDGGLWMHATGVPARDVRCVRSDARLLSLRDVRALEGCWVPGRDVVSICEDVGRVLEEIGLRESRVPSGEAVQEVLPRLMKSLCSLLLRLKLGDPAPPKSPSFTWPDFFASVRGLAHLGAESNSVWQQLSEALPNLGGSGGSSGSSSPPPGKAKDLEQSSGSNSFELTWARCVAYSRRVLRLCDLCDSTETWLPRLFHRFCLRRWQELHTLSVRVLDLPDQTSAVKRPRRKQAGMVRCVVISDTHGWHGDLVLPPGDILFHCGNILFEGCGLGADGAPPQDLLRAIEVLHQPTYSSFEWIFLVGGSHDRPLQEMWAKDQAELCKLLPPNLVVLQTTADLSPALPSCCLARDAEVRSIAQEGAVKLLPGMTLAKPSARDLGVIIAGSGVSLAVPADENSAFQLSRDSPDAHQRAAAAFAQQRPDIAMTHGPPKGHCDGGRGDAALSAALDKCASAKVHLFGHIQESYGVEFEDQCAYVNAGLSTPLCVPAREPIVFDVNPANFERNSSCLLSCSTM